MGCVGGRRTESKKGRKGRKVEGQEEKGKQVTRGKIGGKKEGRKGDERGGTLERCIQMEKFCSQV